MLQISGYILILDPKSIGFGIACAFVLCTVQCALCTGCIVQWARGYCARCFVYCALDTVPLDTVLCTMYSGQFENVGAHCIQQAGAS